MDTRMGAVDALRAQVVLATMGAPGGDGGATAFEGYPGVYERLVAPAPDENVFTDIQKPDSEVLAKIDDFLSKYEKDQRRVAASEGDRSVPLARLPVGAIASNAVATLLDVVQELAAMPSVTFAGVLAALTRADRVAYVGLLLCAIGVVLVLLDVDA